jgi:hypothetical protein
MTHNSPNPGFMAHVGLLNAQVLASMYLSRSTREELRTYRSDPFDGAKGIAVTNNGREKGASVHPSF